MTHILDTDTFTLAHCGNEKVERRIAQVVPPDRVAVSIVTRIEALRGRYDAIRKAGDGKALSRLLALLQATERSLARFDEIGFDDRAFALVDELLERRELRKIDRPDLLIACIGLAHNATVVTRNLKDFRLVPGLKVESWAD